MSSIVVCRLPKVGLGNQLFPLLKACCFAHLNNLPLTIVGYHQIKIGPYLRRERVKRNYSDYFKFQKSILGELADLVKISGNKHDLVQEPELKKTTVETNNQYTYSAIPSWNDYFAGLKEHRSLVIELFNDLINTSIKEKLAQKTPPCIGVHIRMGDFRKLAANEDFSKVGAVRTPEDYFVEMINVIRKIKGTQLPVTIFTDGYISDFEKITLLDNIAFEKDNADIIDMLLLSKSSIILTSAGSTFSYWAAFLSNAPVIMHPDHVHSSLRDAATNKLFFEGVLDRKNPDPLLHQNIMSIQ